MTFSDVLGKDIHEVGGNSMFVNFVFLRQRLKLNLCLKKDKIHQHNYGEKKWKKEG